MSLPAIDTLCDSIPGFPANLCVTMPGGAEICAQVEGLPPSLFALARSALGQANSALAPLTPIFDIIETIAAIQQCLTAIPDALGPPPDPTKLAECLPNLAKKIEKLLSLMPPASVLLMIVQLLDIIIGILEGAIGELQAVVSLLDRIARATEFSGHIPSLLSVIDCGNANATAQLSNIERAIATINPIIDLINVFCGLAGLDTIPRFEGGLPPDVGDAIAALQSLVDPLIAFRNSIPL